MLYREASQYKTSYAADMAVFRKTPAHRHPIAHFQLCEEAPLRSVQMHGGVVDPGLGIALQDDLTAAVIDDVRDLARPRHPFARDTVPVGVPLRRSLS